MQLKLQLLLPDNVTAPIAITITPRPTATNTTAHTTANPNATLTQATANHDNNVMLASARTATMSTLLQLKLLKWLLSQMLICTANAI